MWMMPLHLHVNQKSDYDDDDDAPGCYCSCIWLFSADSIGPIYVFVVLTILWYSEIHGGSFGMGV